MKKFIAFFSLVAFLFVTQKVHAYPHEKAKVEISTQVGHASVTIIYGKTFDVFVNDAIIMEVQPEMTYESVYLHNEEVAKIYSNVMPVANSPPDRC